MSLRDCKYKVIYNKAIDNIAEDFYLPSMRHAKRYDRISGYFSSTIYIIAWNALKEFIEKDGKIRVICSPFLSDEDQRAIENGYEAKNSEIIYENLKKEVDDLFHEDNLSTPNKVLAYLIATGNIEIKIAVGRCDSDPSVGRLFHDKVGIFSDENNSVGFRGSINETFKGLSDDGNLESIDVFTDFHDNNDATRVHISQKYFEDLWLNTINGIRVYDFPESLKKVIRNKTSNIAWQELIDEVTVTIDKSQFWAAEKQKGGRRPRPHQINALENWEANGRKGIFEHATGSGKTYTAMCAIRKSLDKNEVPIVLVPSIGLLDQWHTELETTFKDLEINYLLCGGSNHKWKEQDILKHWTFPSTKERRIVLSTMDTASTESFIQNLHQGDHLFIIADEVHRIGSAGRRNFLNVNTGPRLGLSATPKRYGDPIGSEAIINFFGDIIPPPYTLKDAIDDKVLTPYFYYPHVVRLCPDEQIAWDEITNEIRHRYAKIANKDHSTPLDDKTLNMLLIKRARITKNASGKIKLASDIISDRYKEGQKWIVYCDNSTQLRNVLSELLKRGVDAYEYHSNMSGDRIETLKYFNSCGGVIVSIRCLDEGIDIPSTTHALILASSSNPREFIQRRGRILRRYEGKNFAYLYDAVVVPSNLGNDCDKRTAIVESELSRCIQFGEWSKDKSCIYRLKIIAIEHNIDYTNFKDGGVENE